MKHRNEKLKSHFCFPAACCRKK